MKDSLFGMQWRMENDAKGKNSNIVCRLPLPPDVQSKRDLKIVISQTHLLIEFVISKFGSETVVDSELARKVIADESTWTIEEEDGKRYVVLQLAKKIDGENWTALFESEKSEAEVTNAVKPKLSDAQNEKQMKARAASDLVVLNGLMSKMAPSTRAELDGLLAKGGFLVVFVWLYWVFTLLC
jgi:hypothetical protein